MKEQWMAVDEFISATLVPSDLAFSSALEASTAAALPPIQISPPLGKFLFLMASICQAKRILEIGTLGGYSTIWLGRALPIDGRLTSLEVDPKHAAVAQGNIARANLANKVDVLIGRALDTLPQLASNGKGPFDLIFIDADKSNYPEYFDWSLRLSRKGTVIVADNVIRGGRVIDEASDDADSQGIRRFVEMVGTNRRVAATAIQTVGSKGYDGFAIALVL
jgi:predicted O-methyltransferase YrrM